MTVGESSVGWIGAGRMGSQLVRRVRAAGYAVAVYNRTRAKAEALTDVGVTVVDSPRDLAACDVVFSMVSASPDLEEVVLGENGLLSDPDRAPRIIADASTVSAEASATVRAGAAARGSAFLAVPVSGNPRVVAAGGLRVVASGPRAAFDEIEPLLRTWGSGATYVGEGELARMVKIAHNVFLGVVTQSLAEVTVLAEKAGVPRAAFLDFLNGSVMGSVFTRYKTPALVTLDFAPTFTNVLLQKDFDIALATADDVGAVLPVASVTRNLVAQEVGAGNVSEDFASLIRTVARGSGLELRPEDADVTDGLGST